MNARIGRQFQHVGTNIYYTNCYAIPYEDRATLTRNQRMKMWLYAIGFKL